MSDIEGVEVDQPFKKSWAMEPIQKRSTVLSPSVSITGLIPKAAVAQRRAAIGGFLKRFIDFSLSTLAIVALLPLALIVAAIVKLSDRGPVFYAHTRIGFQGTGFGCLKFRTMRTDGDVVLKAYLKENPAAQKEWDETRKLKSDPRVTFIGAILRKSSLDELPQLINVMRGEMSLVGPRPVTAEELERYGVSVSLYLSARPGLTGEWQTSGRNDVSYEKRVAMDSDYVRHWSMRRDIMIILKTIPALFNQRGSY